MRIFSTFLLLALIAFPAILLSNKNGLVHAEEDAVIEEEADNVADEADVEDEPSATEATAEDEEEDEGLKKSSDATAVIHFVKPVDRENIPAGTQVHLLVGFANNGKADFVVNDIEASFRYPSDYTYILQNFTAAKYGKTVEAGRQASFDYYFYTSDNFNGRPFGLSVLVNYQDAEGKLYQDAVFNATVNVTDNDEGFDGETFFLYVTLAALALLVIVILQQTVFSSASKRLASKVNKATTEENEEIDYDWIPKENLAAAQRKTSPRRRNRNSGTASSGSGDER